MIYKRVSIRLVEILVDYLQYTFNGLTTRTNRRVLADTYEAKFYLPTLNFNVTGK